MAVTVNCAGISEEDGKKVLEALKESCDHLINGIKKNGLSVAVPIKKPFKYKITPKYKKAKTNHKNNK